MENKAFQKSLALLSHPLTLGAILLLFINDHLLRWLWPAWWTGKLGDFAWLFFFPFALSALIAWLIPPRLQRHAEWVRLLSFGCVAGIFTLTKTLPPFHAWLVSLAGQVFGFPVGWKRDPSDLIALLSLVAGLRLWQKTPVRPIERRIPAAIIISLAFFLTVANAPAPDPGIACLGQGPGGLLASSAYTSFTSTDGGLTWKSDGSSGSGSCTISIATSTPVSKTMQIPGDSRLQVRFVSGGNIEKSEDGGRTWETDYQVIPPRQAELAYYMKHYQGSPIFPAPPLDAIADPATGNMIFAMGHRGVLVRRSSGEYVWAKAGQYSKVEINRLDMAASLLSGEILLSIEFGLLTVASLALFLERTWVKIAMTILAVLLWLLPVVIVPPAITNGSYISILPALGLLLAGIFIVSLTLDAFFLFKILSSAYLPRLILSLVVASAAFFFPYPFWALDGIPVYTVAMVSAFFLGAAAWWTAYRWMSSASRAEDWGQKLVASPRSDPLVERLLAAGGALVIIGLVLFGVKGGAEIIPIAVIALGFFLIVLAPIAMVRRSYFARQKGHR